MKVELNTFFHQLKHLTLSLSKLMKNHVKSSLLRFFLLTLSILGCGTANEETFSVEQLPQSNHDIPTFGSTDTIKFVNDVRRFVARKNITGNIKNSLCDTFYRIPIEQFPVNTFLDIFDSLNGKSSCGLSSNMMTKILLDNGIDAYSYNFGFDGTNITHVVTLVKWQGDFLVFDSHTNFELLDSTGSNLGLLSLLENISTENEVTLYYNSDTVSSKFVLETNELTDSELRRLHSKELSPIYSNLDTLANEKVMTHYSKCFECDLNPMGVRLKRSFEEKLAKETRYSKFHEAFTLKVNKVRGAADSDSVDKLIETKLLELGLR